jgi:hypothetical protein
MERSSSLCNRGPHPTIAPLPEARLRTTLPGRLPLRRTVAAIVCLVSCLTTATAQEDYSGLYFFGYMQGCYASISGSILGPRSTTFLLQQANLMATKQFDPEFSTFLNLQFTNSYNSKQGWGSLNLEEGWAKYSYNQSFNIKAGLLTPSFNAMLQVKNRTPLLPYIFRPFVYESIMIEPLNLEMFLPIRANVEVYGTVPVSGVSLEYAMYVGNSESNFIVRDGSSFQVSGMDSTTYKLVGGRIGLSTHWMRAGISASSDKENHVQMGMGALQRYRYGADLSVHVSRLTFDGEAIFVRTTLGDHEKGILTMLRGFYPMLGQDFNRHFLYGTILCDVTDAIFGYGSYSYLQVNDNVGMAEGIHEWTFGGGWRPIEQVVVKGQYVWISSASPIYKLEMGNTILAVSVMF